MKKKIKNLVILLDWTVITVFTNIVELNFQANVSSFSDLFEKMSKNLGLSQITTGHDIHWDLCLAIFDHHLPLNGPKNRKNTSGALRTPFCVISTRHNFLFEPDIGVSPPYTATMAIA